MRKNLAAGVLEQRVSVPQLNPGSWLLAVPIGAYALLVLPFVFHDVVGEPDLERMVMAVIYGASSGLQAAAGYHYGLEVSFGYYWAQYHLLPAAVLLDSSALIAAVNFIGYASAVLAVGALALYVGRLFGVVTAVVTCVLFGFSPVFLDLGTSGHPQVPGLALTLIGAWLLTYATDIGLPGARRVFAGVAAFVALSIALTMRGDFILAFPFITVIAGEQELRSRRAWLQAAAWRLLVLVTAFAVFVAIQAHFYSEPGGNAGFAAKFFATFYKMDTVPRGLLVVVLCTGVATMAAFVALLFSRWARALPLVNVIALLALAVPSLAFWLPNSTPGRHLILVTLAVALAIALILTRAGRAAPVSRGRFAVQGAPAPREEGNVLEKPDTRGTGVLRALSVRPPAGLRPQWAIAIAVLLVIADQAIAEVTHGPLERHYQWTFPLLTARRATQSVPMGTFPLDHEAKQDLFMMLRNEGRAFAHTCSGKVLAFAEEPHYMMLSLVERDRSMRFTSVDVGDTKVIQARGARCSVDFVEKAAAWHHDALREFLEAGYDAGWPIYFQESRRNPSDRTLVPAARRYCIEKAADGRCAAAAAAG